MYKFLKQPHNVIICSLIMIILILNIFIIQIHSKQPTSVAIFRPCVPDEETAVAIAQVMCKVYTGVDLEKEAFHAYGGDKRWQVIIRTSPDEFGDKSGFSNNDGGVFINKQDGTILAVYLNDKDITRYYKLKERYGLESLKQ